MFDDAAARASAEVYAIARADGFVVFHYVDGAKITCHERALRAGGVYHHVTPTTMPTPDYLLIIDHHFERTRVDACLLSALRVFR